MEFQNEFDVEAPIDDVWKAMLDLERVAPAMPGAEVLEKVDDDNYKVGIKVKVGPVSMQYRGDVQFTDKDESTHTATMNVKAREARGQGQATAKVKMALAERGAATHGEMTADVQLSGKAASMGRGIIQDVSARLVQQFANNLATMLAGPKQEAPAEEPAPAEAPPAEEAPAEAPPAEAAAAASNGAPEQSGTLSTDDTVESDAITLDEPKSEPEPEPAPASGASASGAGGGAGAAAAASTVAAEAPKSEAPKAATPPKPSPPRPPSAEPAEIDAMALGASIAKERAKNPVFIGIVALLLLGWLIRRRR